MLTKKSPVPAQHLDITVEIHLRIRHLAPPLRRKDQHRPNAAIDIDQVIFLRRARIKRQIIQPLPMLAQIQRQRL